MVRSPPSSRRGEHGRPTEGAGRPRQRALPARRLFARGRPSGAGRRARRGVRRRAPHARRHLSPPRRVRGRSARAGKGAGHQSQLRRGGPQSRHRLQRSRPVRSRAAGVWSGALARAEPRETGAERRRADGQLHARQDRQPARRGGGRVPVHAAAERRRGGVPAGAFALPDLRGPAPAAGARAARGKRRRRSGGRIPPRRAARARLRPRARGPGHGALRRGQAGRGDDPVGGGAADGSAAPDRRALPQAGALAAEASVSERSYALRFISGKYQGGEYPLADSGELVIGRSSELDLVLIEDMVSRKHAQLTLAAGRITIADLGSTNGTFVNGEKVRRAQLKEGDRILIGTSILKLVARTAGTAPVDARTAQQNLERAAAAQEKKHGSRTTVQGRLEEVPLVDLLQLLSTSKKTGAIVIKGYRGGRVHLRGGKIVSAVIDADPTLPPRKALYRMVSWSQGGFEFVPQEGDLPTMPNEIADATEHLIMDAMQQADALARGGLPAATAAIGIAMPLSPRLRELSPDELDLMQLVHNYGVVQAVLDRASGSDLEVARKIAALIQRGYLRQF